MNIAMIIELFQVYLTDQLVWNYRGSRNKVNQFIAWYVTVLRGTGWSMMGYCGYYVTALDCARDERFPFRLLKRDGIGEFFRTTLLDE